VIPQPSIPIISRLIGIALFWSSTTANPQGIVSHGNLLYLLPYAALASEEDSALSSKTFTGV
jgi:hypothetical protein